MQLPARSRLRMRYGLVRGPPAAGGMRKRYAAEVQLPLFLMTGRRGPRSTPGGAGIRNKSVRTCMAMTRFGCRLHFLVRTSESDRLKRYLRAAAKWVSNCTSTRVSAGRLARRLSVRAIRRPIPLCWTLLRWQLWLPVVDRGIQAYRKRHMTMLLRLRTLRRLSERW